MSGLVPCGRCVPYANVGRRPSLRLDQPEIESQVVAGHPLGRESAVELGPDAAPVESLDPWERRDGFVDGLDDIARHAVVDDFRHRAAAEGQHRRSAGHRLDHDDAERLRPIDRKQQGRRFAEEAGLLGVADLTDKLHQGIAADQRLDHLVPIALVDLVDLGGDLQRDAEAGGNLDRPVRSLLR
jgi:hypothetical protein